MRSIPRRAICRPAVLLQENSDIGRSILKALQNTRYFKVTHQVEDEVEFDRLLASGTVLFGVEIPRGFERAVRRGDRPALLVAADATDPVASGSAMGALGQLVRTALQNDRGLPDAGQPIFEFRTHARYNPGGGDVTEYRAGPCRYHPDNDDADLHRLVGDARNRARHDGSLAGDADHADRDHAR